MEDPNLPNTVEPYSSHSAVVSSRRSRPGPVVGVEERVFQPAFSGKYNNSKNNALLDSALYCSFAVSPERHTSSVVHKSLHSTCAPSTSCVFVNPARSLDDDLGLPSTPYQTDPLAIDLFSPVALPSIPGRTPTSIMEDPSLSNTVEPYFSHSAVVSSRRSRPGPVVGVEEGVFQLAFPGKYNNFGNDASFDPPSNSSDITPRNCESLFNISITLEHRSSSPSIVTEDSVVRPTTSTDLTSSTDSHLERSTRKSNERTLAYYQNVRGLKTKLTDVLIASAECEYDFIMLVETWLDDSINSRQLFNPCYEVYRCDRSSLNSQKRTGGGALIAVKTKFASEQILVNQFPLLEQVCVLVRCGSKKLVLCSFYLPPDKNNDQQILDSHICAIKALQSMVTLGDTVLICGDYNFPNLAWKCDADGIVCLDSDTSRFTRHSVLILDEFASEDLVQTNATRNYLGKTLDLVFLNSSAFVSDMTKQATFCLSTIDQLHPPLEIELPIVADVDFVPDFDPNILNFRKLNFDDLTLFLRQQDWSTVLDAADVDSAVRNFSSILTPWLIANVPRRKPSPNPPWSNVSLQHKKRLKIRP